MSLAQGNNTPTRPRIEPGSPDPESAALTIRPVRSPFAFFDIHEQSQAKGTKSTLCVRNEVDLVTLACEDI